MFLSSSCEGQNKDDGAGVLASSVAVCGFARSLGVHALSTLAHPFCWATDAICQTG